LSFQDESGDPPFTEFYFKCAQHQSGGKLPPQNSFITALEIPEFTGEKDFAVPLSLIKTNLKDVPCLACTDIW
jgi:parkin